MKWVFLQKICFWNFFFFLLTMKECHLWETSNHQIYNERCQLLLRILVVGFQVLTSNCILQHKLISFHLHAVSLSLVWFLLKSWKILFYLLLFQHDVYTSFSQVILKKEQHDSDFLTPLGDVCFQKLNGAFSL